MQTEETSRLYALALHLIPDHDVAGDLFMDARSEADLRRRAASWRARHGLPPPDASAAPASLTRDQEEDAHHLHRRGLARRRARRLLIGAVGVAVIAALVVLTGIRRADMTRDDAFRGQPVGTSEPENGLRLAVYRAEATPGTVTVWWDVSGPGAGAGAGEIRPDLVLSGSGQEWQQPVVSHAAKVFEDRLVGRSTYRVAVGNWDTAVLQVATLQGRAVRWVVRTPLTKLAADPQARAVPVQGKVGAHGWTFTVLAVERTPLYTRLRYRVEPPAATDPGRHFVQVDLGSGKLLGGVGPPSMTGQEAEWILYPLPADVGSVKVHFATEAPGGAGFSTPRPGELTRLGRTGAVVTAQITLDLHRWERAFTTPLPLSDWPVTLDGSHFVDRQGRRYPAVVIYQGANPNRPVFLWRLEAEIPSSVPVGELTVRITGISLTDPSTVTINLR